MNLKDKLPKILFPIIFISILFASDISILCNLPYLSSILAFIILFIPGILLLEIINFERLELIQKFILSLGLSVSIILLFGLILNYLGFILNFNPISAVPLLIMFNLIIVALIFINSVICKNELKIPKIKINTFDKIILIVGCYLPILSIYGAINVNQGDSNVLLMIFLISIPVYLILMGIFSKNLSSKVYPFALLSISFSLLAMYLFRFTHLYGNDINIEYNYFYITLNQMKWVPLTNRAVYSSLSISLLPAVFESLTRTNAEYLYRIILIFIGSFTPIVVYYLSKIYIKDIYAVFAAVFFISQSAFLNSAASARTTVAIFFVALVILLYFSEIKEWKKILLIILFLFSGVVSHYSTTYILFFILLAVTILTSIISKKYRIKRGITWGVVTLLYVIIFLWYSQVSHAAFVSGTDFIRNVILGINKSFVSELKSENLSLLTGQGLKYPILSRINLIITWSTFLMIGFGSFFIIKNYKSTTNLFKNKIPDFFRKKMSLEFVILIFVSIFMLLMTVILPYISQDYDIYRIYGVVTIVLSLCFVVGCIYFSKLTRINKSKFMVLIILIPYFLFATGFIYQLSGSQGSVVLSNVGETIDLTEIKDTDSLAIFWMTNYVNNSSVIYVTDSYAASKLYSQSNGKIDIEHIYQNYFVNKKKIEGFIYFGYVNTYLGKILVNGELADINNFKDVLLYKNEIYDSGYSQIWVSNRVLKF